MDVLPPSTQGRVNAARAANRSNVGSGPLQTGRAGRQIAQNPDYTGIDIGDGSGQEELLVNQLLGVVLVPTPGDVRPEGWKGVEGVWHDFDEFPQEVGWALQKYLRKPVSLTSLDRMVKDVIVAYREGDRPVVDVLLPEQDITSGVVQLVVIESKLARIRVEGVDVETEQYIRSQMRVRKGEVIRASEVLHDLALINRSPYRKVDLAYAPGLNFGETDIILKPYTSKANSAFIGYEDSGTQFLGIERLVAGVNLGEFGRPGRSLSYQFTSDLDFEHILGHTVVYSRDLPWRHNLTLLASFVDIETPYIADGLPLESSGFNWQLSARYNIPLKQKEWEMCPPMFGAIQRRRNLDFGFDFKTNDNNLEFGGAPLTAASSTVEIYQFSIGYNEAWQHPEGVSQFDIRGFYSPGEFSPHNSDGVFGASRFLSDSKYLYATANFEHQHQLLNDWALRFNVLGQLSDGNLQPSEQIGIGGYDRVRGVDQRVVIGDEGLYGTVELYTPDMSLGRYFDWKYSTDTLKLLTFLDAATVSNVDLIPGIPGIPGSGEPANQSLASVGVGMRWVYNDFFRLRIDYGYPVLSDTPLNPNLDTTGRWHIGATATF